MEGKKESVYVVKQSEAKVVNLRSGRGTMAKLIDLSVGAKNVDFHINTLRPGPQEGLLHYHNIRENVYFVLQGKICIRTPAGRYMVESGEAAFIPAGVKHAVWNPGAEEARLIEIYAPCAENDFVEVAE